MAVSKTAMQSQSSNLSLPPGSYIYHIKPLEDSLLASASDNTLRLFDSELQLQAKIHTKHPDLNCLGTDGKNQAFTGGTDGIFSAWDFRAGTALFENRNQTLGPITSLAISGNRIAVGTELTNHAAVVSVWDIRQQLKPLLRLDECHNDDVTELVWSPYLSGAGEAGANESRYLLSGSTDTLVNIYDINQSDPDDALVKILNPGSSVSHAGFLASPASGRESIYAISHDEQMTVWQVSVEPGESASVPRYRDDEEESEESEDKTIAYGDVRPILDCEYVIDVVSSGNEKVLGVGKHSEGYVDLVHLSVDRKLDKANAIRLPGAHGEEIVRTFYVHPKADLVFTGGEDGMVRSWKTHQNGIGSEKDRPGPARGKKGRSDSKAHLFKPY